MEHTSAHERSYVTSGQQVGASIGGLMSAARHDMAGRVAAVDGDVSLRWDELIDAATAFAGFLVASGGGPGDVVLWQLPNWWEALVVGYGAWAAGAVSCPVVPMFREYELRAVIDAVRPSVVVTAEEFRGCRHADLFSDVLAATGTAPKAQVVVRGATAGWTGFEATQSARPTLVAVPDPDQPALYILTSGTTSGAKVVVHSTRTFLASPVRLCRWYGFTFRTSSYVVGPMAHIGSMTTSFGYPLWAGTTAVLRDRWDAEQALTDLLARPGMTMGGPPVFAQELMAAMRARGVDRLDLPNFSCGAAGFPVATAEDAERTGLAPNRAYGMSECPFVSASHPTDPAERRITTDGRLQAGTQVRVVDEHDVDVAGGAEGELLVQGPQRALAYLDPEQTAAAFLPGGWFRSGDLGRLDAAGFLTVTGRLKDIINRGGEKISAREIEDLLVAHPAVMEAAVVAAPHERLGEQPAAFVRFHDGATTSFDELATHLRAHALSSRKVPLVWREVDDFPRTGAGKIKKFVLAQELAG
jgi:acyl-CoA synthetase